MKMAISAICCRLGTFFMICGQTVNRIELDAKEYKNSILRAIKWYVY